MTSWPGQCSYRLPTLLAIAMLVPLHASATPSGLQAMDEAALSAVSAHGNKMIGTLTVSLDKGLTFVDVETTLVDVSYDPARAKTFVNTDGSITQILPNTIGEVSFDHIRVKGTAPGASFGSISIKAIDLTGTSLILAPKR